MKMKIVLNDGEVLIGNLGLGGELETDEYVKKRKYTMMCTPY